MKTCKRVKIITILLSLILCLTYPCFTHAASEVVIDTKAVVFLLDASGSMKTNDPKGYAIDGIAQLIYTLPTNYEVGFVAYNTEICAGQAPLDNGEREQIMKLAKGVQYSGYSNAGAGLEQAVEFLAQSSAKEKNIVMLSDGEFLMVNEELTKQSRESYQKAMETAKEKGMKIHVIGLGKDMENTKNSIFQAATYTAGGSYYTPQALEIQSAIDAILNEQLKIKQMTAAIVDAEGSMEKVSLDLPFSYASKVRILLTSNSAIENLQTNVKAEGARQIRGERYSLIEVDKPQSNRLEIGFVGTAGTQVRITLIPEYKVTSKVEILYQDREPEEKTAVRYDREATIKYTFYDAENENIQLWKEEYFQHGRIILREGEKEEEVALERGQLISHRTVKEERFSEVTFDCSSLPVNVLGTAPVEVALEAPPLLPVKKPPYILYLILAGTIIGITAVLIYGRKKPQPEVIPESDGRPAPGKASYVGKINLYVTRAPSGYDIRPLSYDLFRLPSSKVISLAEVLESCGVKEVFEGAGRIYINSGQGRSIILTNQSDCCIMKSGEILMKQKSYQLFEESKVDITFEDEISELTFQYKVLRPSQMR